MDVSNAIRNRHSCRSFLDREVERERIERILRLASRSPSGGNTQPWHVAVVTGQTKLAIEHETEAELRAGNRGSADYRYYPTQWEEPYRSRRVSCGMQLYSALGIERDDKERRLEQWIQNYRSFGAPMLLFFYIGQGLEVGSLMDMGMFIQTVMLLAEGEGLATCAQEAWAEYPTIVKRRLDIGHDTMLLCGMAVGYEDKRAPVNQYRTPRGGVDEFVSFYS